MRRILKVAVLPAVAVLLVAPALATDADYEGFYIELDAALATPGNTNTAVAASNPSVFGLFGGRPLSEVAWTEWDDTVTPSFTLGYSWGEKGRLQVTYWTYSDDTDSDGGFPAYYSYPWMTIGPVGGLGYYGYFPALYGMDYDFKQEIEASTFDLEYLRPFTPGEKLEMTLGFGLRIASFEEDVDGRYTLDPNDFQGRIPIPAFRRVESDGYGLTGRVGVEYQLTQPFGVASDLRLGFLTAEVDAEHGWQFSGVGINPGEAVSVEDEMAFTMDFSLSGRFGLGDYVDLDVGWLYTSWWDMPQVPLSRGDVRFAVNGSPLFNTSGMDLQGENRDRITWSGPRIALDIRFGK